MSSAAPVPRLVIRDAPAMPSDMFASALAGMSPFGALLQALVGPGEDARQALKALVLSLIEEGRKFAETPSGQRWVQLLEGSPAVNHGWMLWNQANIDYHLRNATPLPDGPVTMLETVLQDLATSDTVALAGQLSRLAGELEAAAGRGTA
jgi:hypothetical protein